MTHRNLEHTGHRKLTRLSRIVREIPGCRNLDLDMTFYCPRPQCGEFTAFIEVKTAPPDSWLKTRDLARKHRCFGILDIEHDDTSDLFTYDARTGGYRVPQFKLTDDQVRDWLEKLHQEHRC